jgi:hypothetical protein
MSPSDILPFTAIGILLALFHIKHHTKIRCPKIYDLPHLVQLPISTADKSEVGATANRHPWRTHL